MRSWPWPVAHAMAWTGAAAKPFPRLQARDETELLELMRALKEPREGVTIMPRILRAYDDDELKALAGHFARMRP